MHYISNFMQPHYYFSERCDVLDVFAVYTNGSSYPSMFNSTPQQQPLMSQQHVVQPQANNPFITAHTSTPAYPQMIMQQQPVSFAQSATTQYNWQNNTSAWTFNPPPANQYNPMMAPNPMYQRQPTPSAYAPPMHQPPTMFTPNFNQAFAAPSNGYHSQSNGIYPNVNTSNATALRSLQPPPKNSLIEW
jgi:hypothetical protein